MIKAAAEQLRGSGVSTWEESMAAAGAAQAALPALPLQECGTASGASLAHPPSCLLPSPLPTRLTYIC